MLLLTLNLFVISNATLAISTRSEKLRPAVDHYVISARPVTATR